MKDPQTLHDMPVVKLMFMLDNGSDEECDLLIDMLDGMFASFQRQHPRKEKTQVIPFKPPVIVI